MMVAMVACYNQALTVVLPPCRVRSSDGSVLQSSPDGSITAIYGKDGWYRMI